MDNMKQDMGAKAKIKAILSIIDQMDEMELEGLSGSEEKPVGVTMVSVEKKPSMKGHMMEDSMESEEPTEDTAMDQMEDVSEGEDPETEEEIDPNSALGKLRKRLKGVA
ncbi:hypothetical protein UFOVP683_14 [uncultured Caudovirales phage]|uniref:Uncharacterized protein n=1 Tax=uncultured Caudovirales phage TaxID=2100421 RepID=A0A6J5NIM7_9CAUD|nr:hypothetical protein UFOVP683_14 [uncultured Caudovirales phage]